MARPLRYEAAGAIYHIMARGDGGKDVFEDDVDRKIWLKRIGEVCESHGWKVHAWVMMGNHFHLLLETPEANLVSGMKWFMGVFSQDWNRKRGRRGHVFQGRYKSVIVNGEGSGYYFRIVADYIHLNPVRSGWVGGKTGKKLNAWPWSSFPQYGRRKASDWLVKDRVLRAFELSEDQRGGRSYTRYLEERSKDRSGALNDASLKFLRRGWCVGEEGFGEKLLKAMKRQPSERSRKSLSGGAAKAHDQYEAERLLKLGLNFFKMPNRPGDLAGKGRWLEEKSILTALVRKHTNVRNNWLAGKLAMGGEANVSVALKRVRESRALMKKLNKLEAEVK